MIDRESLAQPVVRVALGGFALSAVLAVTALVHAVARPAEVIAAVPLDNGAMMPPIPPRELAGIGEAVENDPFSPFREAPPQSYRLPGEKAPVASAPREEAPVPVVLGIALMGPGHDFATCQLPNGAPAIVRVGDKVGEYTVKSIERGHVVFARDGRSLDVPALKSGT